MLNIPQDWSVEKMFELSCPSRYDYYKTIITANIKVTLVVKSLSLTTPPGMTNTKQ
jgi:hypothetical protein